MDCSRCACVGADGRRRVCVPPKVIRYLARRRGCTRLSLGRLLRVIKALSACSRLRYPQHWPLCVVTLRHKTYTKLRQYKRRRRSPFPMNGQSIPGHDSAQNTAVLLRLETAGGMDVRAQNDPHQARHHLGARARRKVRSQVIGGAHPSHNVC